MNKFIFLLIILLFVNCKNDRSTKETSNAANEISFGQIDSLYSETLGESRKIWVHLPAGADDPTFSSKKYPVLYLLDGPGHFYSVTGMIRQLSTSNGNTVVPQMIIVAIPNTNRTRDLTPTHTDINPFGSDVAWLKDSGGGEKFNDFLENELIPFIDKKYSTTTYRTYVGHSLGGLAVINTLITRPHLFSNYVAIDPSMWWDDQALLKKAKSQFEEIEFKNKSLFIGIANTLPDNGDITSIESDTSKTTIHIRSILDFVKTGDKYDDNGLLLGWKYYPDDDHGSVPMITEYDALRFLFPWYRFKEINAFFDTENKASGDDLVSAIETHYKTISNNFGYEVIPDEEMVNSLGYNFMQSEKLDLSFAAFDLNIKNYPNSSNVYDSMGDYFLAAKDSVKALESFEKALQVGPNDFSQEKIDMLKSKAE